MNPKVDLYLEDGCGRCEYYQTPQCKVYSWTKELKELRKILLASGLNEEFKWKQPCYTLNGKNILIMSAFKEYCALSFFKGSLLSDPAHILIKPGENSQATRQVRFTNVREIAEMKLSLKAYIFEAIENERNGLKVTLKKKLEPIP